MLIQYFLFPRLLCWRRNLNFSPISILWNTFSLVWSCFSQPYVLFLHLTGKSIFIKQMYLISLIWMIYRCDVAGKGLFTGHGIQVPWTPLFYFVSFTLSLIMVRAESFFAYFHLYSDDLLKKVYYFYYFFFDKSLKFRIIIHKHKVTTVSKINFIKFI